MSKLANQPAFPTRADECYADGMTIRQHYAGLAMQGYIASTPDADWKASAIAKLAVGMADALIAELE